MPQGARLGPLTLLDLINDQNVTYTNSSTIRRWLKCWESTYQVECRTILMTSSPSQLIVSWILMSEKKKTKETRLGAGASKQQYQDLILEGKERHVVQTARYTCHRYAEMGCPHSSQVVHEAFKRICFQRQLRQRHVYYWSSDTL